MAARRRASAAWLVVLLFAACLGPVLVHGVVGTPDDEDDYALSGAADDAAAGAGDEDDTRVSAAGDDDAAERAEDEAEDAADEVEDRSGLTSTVSSATTTAPPTTTTTAPPATTTTTAPPPDTEPAPRPEPTTPGLAPVDMVLALVNQVRSEVGCPPLTLDDRLVAAAQLHSEDMAARNYMDHVSPEGTAPDDRAAAQGYTGPVGENVAQGYPSAEAVMDAWMESSGHRQNIENCSYRVIGIGLSPDGWYWTQLFGM